MMGLGSGRSGPAAASALAAALGALAWACLESPLEAEVCNIKVVTDANPDYSDIGSMIHSITANWPQTKDKCWAIYYWNHIARRQTAPIILHGMELTDPMRQFNDYGYTMCSTISGINCAIFAAHGAAGEVLGHQPAHRAGGGVRRQVPHVRQLPLGPLHPLRRQDPGGRGGHRRRRGVRDSGGRTEPGHIAKYHCLNATSNNGFLTGCDTQRSVAEEYRCFNPNGLKYRYYFNSWDLGHRYILNLRPGESLHARLPPPGSTAPPGFRKGTRASKARRGRAAEPALLRRARRTPRRPTPATTSAATASAGSLPRSRPRDWPPAPNGPGASARSRRGVQPAGQASPVRSSSRSKGPTSSPP